MHVCKVESRLYNLVQYSFCLLNFWLIITFKKCQCFFNYLWFWETTGSSKQLIFILWYVDYRFLELLCTIQASFYILMWHELCIHEGCCHLGCDAVQSGRNLPMCFCTLKIEAAGSFETSVNVYQIPSHYNPEHTNLHSHSCVNECC